MSILSKFLKSKLGLPEINLNDKPIFQLFKNEIINRGGKIIFKDVTLEDLQFVKLFIDAEIYRRNLK
jgi:hypothetical protein